MVSNAYRRPPQGDATLWSRHAGNNSVGAGARLATLRFCSPHAMLGSDTGDSFPQIAALLTADFMPTRTLLASGTASISQYWIRAVWCFPSRDRQLRATDPCQCRNALDILIWTCLSYESTGRWSCRPNSQV